MGDKTVIVLYNISYGIGFMSHICANSLSKHRHIWLHKTNVLRRICQPQGHKRASKNCQTNEGRQGGDIHFFRQFMITTCCWIHHSQLFWLPIKCGEVYGKPGGLQHRALLELRGLLMIPRWSQTK